MIRIDDRTQDELATHRWLIVGTDSFLSGWGEAEGGTSVAAWACRPEDRLAVLAWVRSRGEMKRVREVAESGSGARYTPRGNVAVESAAWSAAWSAARSAGRSAAVERLLAVVGAA